MTFSLPAREVCQPLIRASGTPHMSSAAATAGLLPAALLTRLLQQRQQQQQPEAMKPGYAVLLSFCRW
jgi:hypothetical protein